MSGARYCQGRASGPLSTCSRCGSRIESSSGSCGAVIVNVAPDGEPDPGDVSPFAGQIIVEKDAEIAALRARVEESEKALRFYADEMSWRVRPGHAPALNDCGEKARTALGLQP